MLYHVQLGKGILYPNTHIYQISQAEKITGLYKRFFLLLFASVLIYLIGSYYGIGMESVSGEITSLSNSELEAKKLFVLIGQVLKGAIFSIIVFYLPAIFYWAIFNVYFKKLLVMQTYVLAVLLVEKLLLIPLQIFLQIGWESSPFGLGVLMQYMSDYKLIIYLAGSITIFKVWVIFYQINWLKGLVESKTNWLIAVVILFNIFIWIITALISHMELGRLI